MIVVPRRARITILDATGYHCRANMAHVRQSGPDSGLGFQVFVIKTFKDVPSSLGRGERPRSVMREETRRAGVTSKA